MANAKEAKAKSVSPPAPAEVDDPAADGQPGAFHQWIMGTGIWYVVSMVVHCVALVSAGLMMGPVAASTVEKARTFDSVIERPPEQEDLTRIEPEEPQLEPPDLDLEMTPQLEVADVSSGLAGVDTGEIINAVSMNVGTPGGFDLSGLGAGPAVRGSGGLVIGPGNGLPGKGGTSFFGASARGQRFCFVVDNSRSMGGGAGNGATKWDRAKEELLKSVSKLSRGMSYYIVFFAAGPTRIFDPDPPERFVLSTPENYEKLEAWLPTVELILGTRGTEAMQIALDLKPDAIYILGDGAFGDDVVSLLPAMNPKKVPINTLLFGGKGGDGKGRAGMEQIADENKGTFMLVQ